MRPIVRTLVRSATRLATAMYRLSGGRVGDTARGGTRVLLLTVPGRVTGEPRTTPVSYVEAEGGYLVTGTAAGADKDPQWFLNLRSSPTARVQIGTRHEDVAVHVADPALRDRLWRDVVVAQAPSFQDYQTRSGARIIPIAVLTPR